MKFPYLLSDDQLRTLQHSLAQLDPELQEKVLDEMKARNLAISPPPQQKNQEELSGNEKLLFLIPIPLITIIAAAKYQGQGEMRKYKQAWRLQLMSFSLLMLIGCLYFVLSP